jgi:8-oxo-dGTP pyrophosphatase MutT (NUDIX family)
MRAQIREEVAAVEPLDELEAATISDVIDWIDSGGELCRIEKPATPRKHLVAYFPVVDGDYLLLVDHINAEKWLPSGGHVEPHEHPRQTAVRECFEELKIEGVFLVDGPVLITSTETVGKTAGHIDVSIWYALKGDRLARIEIDASEFREARWFRRDELPENTDPHLGRFVQKLYGLKRIT